MNLYLIDRRCFLRAGTTAIGTLAASGLPGRQGRAEPAGRLDRIGLQLYTVRHDFIRNVDETLAAVARVGYSEVELFSPYAPQGWMVHAWIWKDIPAGVFSPINPDV
jgi:hypothetical protein